MDFQFEDNKAQVYKTVRDSSAKRLRSKHIRQFDKEFLTFCDADPSMSVVDIGCGAGLFLHYLRHRGFKNVVGVDYDENMRVLLADLEDTGFTIETAEAETFVDRVHGQRKFERIVLFDILEHLELDKCVRLLRKLHGILDAGGKILIRVPNATSPWGIRMQFDTFDHVTVFSPGRLHELATITGYKLTAIAGQTTGKRRKLVFQRCLHWLLSRILSYYPEIWEAALICTFEAPASTRHKAA